MNRDYERFKAREAWWGQHAAAITPGKLAVAEPAALPAMPPIVGARHYRSERKALKGAISRCHLPTNKNYADYGGRGIPVCASWRGPYGFEDFIGHIGPKPTNRHTLDRIDNARGYEPGNVRWASWIEQANNRRSSKFVTFEGETRTAAEWGRLVGVPRQSISNAVNKGRPLARLLKPLRKVAP